MTCISAAHEPPQTPAGHLSCRQTRPKTEQRDDGPGEGMRHCRTARPDRSMVPGVTDESVSSADLVAPFHRSTVPRSRIYRCLRHAPLSCAYLAVLSAQPLFLAGELLDVIYGLLVRIR